MTHALTIHHQRDPQATTAIPDPHQDTFSKTVLGFWMYLMTDCMLFATLFATYAVLRHNTFGGPTAHDITDLSTAFIETIILLCSSVTCGLAMLSAVQSKKRQSLIWLLITAALGITFIALELHEFALLVEAGHSWTRSAFLSAFFTLVGTHGLHVTIGLMWIAVMAVQLAVQGITVDTFRRLTLFSMYWHFLDLIWIFIFTFVYLMGAL